MRARSRLLLALVMPGLMLVTVAMVSTPGATPAAAMRVKPPPTEYYVAMGDSLGQAGGATAYQYGYVNLVYQHELTRSPGLQLENLSCDGASTTSVIGPSGCTYATGTQLGDAESFLRAHAGHVALLTIDIGANDVDQCADSSGIDTGCVDTGVAHITTNLPLILSGLNAAYPGLAMYGMDYYDPFLADWLSGPSGQVVATQSEADTVALNSLLTQVYTTADAATADPATLFQITNFAPTSSYMGMVLPENVALACQWTNMCDDGDFHADDAGHAQLAAAFEQVIDDVTVNQGSLPSGSVKVSYTTTLTSTGGNLPCTWSVASGSLPPGLRLHRTTGAISGKPRSSGTYSFSVQVRDTKNRTPPATQDSATGAFSITIG